MICEEALIGNMGGGGGIAYTTNEMRAQKIKSDLMIDDNLFQYIKYIIYTKLHFHATYASTFGFLEMLAWRESVTEMVVPAF